MTTDTLPLLLMLRTGRRELREYLLSSIATRYRVHMLIDREPDWELEYIAGHTVVDTFNTEQVLTAAGAVAGREAVTGAMTWDESRTVQSARIASALGLPGGEVSAIE